MRGDGEIRFVPVTSLKFTWGQGPAAYTEKLFSLYVRSIQNLRVHGPARAEGKIGCSEGVPRDGESSHSFWTYKLARRLKEQDWRPNISHPADSPDSNPQESVRNISNQRTRWRTWYFEQQLNAKVSCKKSGA
jgi:hypothetical protein